MIPSNKCSLILCAESGPLPLGFVFVFVCFVVVVLFFFTERKTYNHAEFDDAGTRETETFDEISS